MVHYNRKPYQSSIQFRLMKAMDKAKLNGKELAAISKVSVSGISGYINGRCEPTRATVNRLADALGVSSDWLMGVAPLEMEIPGENTEDSLLSLYRGLSEKNRDILYHVAVALNKAQASKV